MHKTTCVRHERPLKVLYLIHGGGDDYSAWINNTRLALYAEKHPELLIVMSTVRDFQSFRTDVDYYEYVSRELPEYIGRLFNISHRREDTYIAGLSMGGYGALRIGLKHPEKYGRIGAFSAGVRIVERVGEDSAFGRDLEDVFGQECAGADVTWDESEHGHEWAFWNRQIEKFINWPP